MNLIENHTRITKTGDSWLGQAQKCGGIKSVLWDHNSPPLPLANVEKQTHINTHSKAQFKRSPSPMSI